MSDPLLRVKPAVRAAAAYTLAARRAPVKINQNENPFDLPEAVKRRVLAAALSRPWSRYPDFDPRELREKLAAFSGWRADGILCGNGSNELIEALLLVTVGAGTRVVIPEPTFTLYALMTTILGGEAVRVRLTTEMQYDESALETAHRTHGMSVICSPNNPTGNEISSAAIGRLAGQGGLLVLDQAYHEFSGGESVVPLLEKHPNLVVLRTFSKAMGMAGLRIGYLLAAPELVREINKARLPYNLNFFSQAAAMAAIECYEAQLLPNVKRLVRLREELASSLSEFSGVRVYPSRANFLLVEFLQADPKDVFEALYANGVLVRDVTSYPMLERCLRITVGSETENEALLEAISAAILAGSAARKV
jgi:histidinol-phosphate aminotransferase